MRDTPPGHRRWKFGSHHYDAAEHMHWRGEPGDIVLESGPRLGQRWWQVVDVEHLRIWSTVLLRQCHRDEALTLLAEAGDPAGWWMHDLHIDEYYDLTKLAL